MSVHDPSAFAALFDPQGVIVAGASSHPGKFGFVVLHNILRHGYGGKVFATNVDGGEILGVTAQTSIECIPDGAADLVFVCTPVRVNAELVRDCARKGVRAAFVMTGGYAEAGADGRRAEHELAAIAEEAGILLAGPNGQGIVSTPSSLCAQMVAPYPPAGRIGIASQSGNIVSTFENLALSTGIGISRAVSAGNAAVVGVADYLEFFAADPATDVGLAYLEGVRDGRALFEALRPRRERATTRVGARGSRPRGPTGRRVAHRRARERRADLRRACAGRRASTSLPRWKRRSKRPQPSPRSRYRADPNVAVLTTAGGWGVLTADALGALGAVAARVARRPPRGDRRAAAATVEPRQPDRPGGGRDARHHPADLGTPRGARRRATRCCSSARACSRTRRSSCAPATSRRATVSSASSSSTNARTQRYAQVAADVSAASGKPILIATELAVTDPDNPGPRTVRETGKLCYWFANRAVTALEHLWRRARFLEGHAQPMSIWQRLIAAILAIGAVVAVVLAFADDNSASGTTVSTPAVTPLWSPRRVPQPLVDAVGAQRLQGVLDAGVRRRGNLLPRRRQRRAAGKPQSRHTAHRRVHPEDARRGGDARDARTGLHVRDEGRRARRTRQRVSRSALPRRQRGSGARHERVPRLPPDARKDERRRHHQPRYARRQHRRRRRATHAPGGIVARRHALRRHPVRADVERLVSHRR